MINIKYCNRNNVLVYIDWIMQMTIILYLFLGDLIFYSIDFGSHYPNNLKLPYYINILYKHTK